MSSLNLWDQDDQDDDDDDDINIKLMNSSKIKSKNTKINDLFDVETENENKYSEKTLYNDKANSYSTDLLDSDECAIDYKILYFQEKKKRLHYQKLSESLQKQLNQLLNISENLNDKETSNTKFQVANTMDSDSDFDEYESFLYPSNNENKEVKQDDHYLFSHHTESSTNVSLQQEKVNHINDIIDNNILVQESSTRDAFVSRNERLNQHHKIRQNSHTNARSRMSMRRPASQLKRTIQTTQTLINPMSDNLETTSNTSTINTASKLINSKYTNFDSSDDSGWDSPSHDSNSNSNDKISSNIHDITPNEINGKVTYKNEYLDGTKIEELECEIDAKIISWARSRNNLVHMLLTVNEVFNGELPTFDYSKAIQIDDSGEVRKLYL